MYYTCLAKPLRDAQQALQIVLQYFGCIYNASIGTKAKAIDCLQQSRYCLIILCSRAKPQSRIGKEVLPLQRQFCLTNTYRLSDRAKSMFYCTGLYLQPCSATYMATQTKDRHPQVQAEHTGHGSLDTAEDYLIQLVHIDKYLCTDILNCAYTAFYAIDYIQYLHGIHGVYTILTKCLYTAYTRLKYWLKLTRVLAGLFSMPIAYTLWGYKRFMPNRDAH